MGYSTRKFEKQRTERPWTVHPIWRGIGCFMIILIPIMAWAGMNVVMQSELITKLPVNFTQPVYFKLTDYDFVNLVVLWLNANLGERGFTFGMVIFFLGFLLVGYLLLVILYGVMLRMIGPPRHGPLDAPAIKKGTQR
jgi:hypothetical protein